MPKNQHNKHKISDKSTNKITGKPRLNRDHLIKDFIELQKRLGRRPTILEYKRNCHTLKVLDRVFGNSGWRQLIKALGKKALPKGPLTAEHLIQDYLETCTVLFVQEVTYAQFNRRHRHLMKTLDRVFGEPGFKRLKQAANKTTLKTKKQNMRRSEHTIMEDIRKTYRALLPGRMIDGLTTREKSQESAWKLRNDLHDLFHELGRVVSMEDAFQKSEVPAQR